MRAAPRVSSRTRNAAPRWPAVSRASAIAPDGTAMSRSRAPAPLRASRTAPPTIQAGRSGPSSRARARSTGLAPAPKASRVTRGEPVTRSPGSCPRCRGRSSDGSRGRAARDAGACGCRCSESRPAPPSGPHHPGARPARHLDIAPHAARFHQARGGLRRLRRVQAEDPRHASRRRVDRAVQIADEKPVERRRALQCPTFGHLFGQPALEQVPAVGEAGLIALLGLDYPEALLELGHGSFEFARLGRFERERVCAEPARVLWALAGKAVHEPLCRRRHAPGAILRGEVARALAAAHQRVESREEIEGDQYGTPLQKLAVVAAAARRQRVLELPGQADASVVVGMTGPAWPLASHHRLPEAGEALRKPIKGGANPDRVPDGGRRTLGAHPQTRKMTEAPRPFRLERPRFHRQRYTNSTPRSVTRYSAISSLLALPRCFTT